MPWFKVDDKLHSHRKVIRAGIPAMGLWAVAGSWCADQLSDGFIPDYVAERLDPDFAEHSAALVAAKLWIAGERDGESGWYFHQWSEEGRQPTSESVNAKRDEARERMAKLRAARAEEAKSKRNGSQGVRANAANMFAGGSPNAATGSAAAMSDARPIVVTTVPTGPPATVTTLVPNPRATQENATEQQEQVASGQDFVRANKSRTSEEVRSTPTRPDPTRTSYGSKDTHPAALPLDIPEPTIVADNAALTRERFNAFWKAYPRKVAKPVARKAFAAAIERGADPDAITAAATAHREFHKAAQTADRYIPHPSTWLNQERYDDEPQALPAEPERAGYHPFQNRPASAYQTGW